MATGNKIEDRGHILGFREEIDSTARHSTNSFFTWFDNAEDADTAFIRGQWDFMVHIGLPLSPYISQPEKKIALEIGHGGGRILAAACRSFKKTIGIDIHDSNELVDRELRKRGVSNFNLLRVDGRNIPVEDHSVEIVYSFIVLQHVEKIVIFKNYLQETYRILRPGGVAILYFGRKYFFSKNRKSKILYWFDCFIEKLFLRNGFKEKTARVNETNLLVSSNFCRKFSNEIGFRVLEKVVSRKRVPDGMNLYGGQHGLILKKENK